MAVSFRGAEFVTSAAVVSLTTVLGLSAKTFVSHFVVRAGAGNTGDIYIGGSDLTTAANRWAYLDATESYTISQEGGSISTDFIFFAASVPTDVIHVVVLA